MRAAVLGLLVALLAAAPGTLAGPPKPAAPAVVSAPVLKWQDGGCTGGYCDTGWYASPAVADLDGDGTREVIWTDYRIVVINGESGTIQWAVDNPGFGRGWPGVVVADVDANGSLEIVTAHGNGWVAVTQANGNALAGWPLQITPGNEIRSLAVADVDGNGDLEIGICSTRSADQWFLLEHDASIRPGWPVLTVDSDTTGYAAGCYNQNIGLADLDGDGRGELIGPNDTHYTVGYNDDGTPIRASAIYGLVGGVNKPWARVGFHYDHAVDLQGYANCTPGQPPLEPRPNFADSAPTFADVNGDGVLEIIIVGNQYDCRGVYISLFHSPYILNLDRTRWAGSGFDWTTLPGWDSSQAPLAEDYNVIETALPNPVAADLDGDGLREILYASYDGRLHAYWLDKTEHGSWPYEVTLGDGVIRFASEPAVVDLDRDGQAEVIFTTWTQKGSAVGGQLIVASSMGSLLHAVDLPRSTDDWDGGLAAPTIDNIDGDADLEIVVGTAHTGLAAYDLPGSAGARVLWGTGRGSYLRAGTPPACVPNVGAGLPAPPAGPVVVFLPFIRQGC